MYLQTRELDNRRDELKDEVLDDFLDTFEHYKEMTETFEDIRFDEEELEGWEYSWRVELEEIQDIDNLEVEVGDLFEEKTLIPEDEFTDYCENSLKSCGTLPDTIPHYIEIDMEKTTDNMKVDYKEVEFRDETYLYRY